MKTALELLGIEDLEPPSEVESIADKTMRHHRHERTENDSSLSQNFFAALSREEPELDFRAEIPVDKETIEMPLVGIGVVHFVIPSIDSWGENCFAPWTIDDAGNYVAECPHRIVRGYRHATPQGHAIPGQNDQER